MSFIVESRAGARIGAGRLAAIAMVVAATLTIGYVPGRAGTAVAASRAGSAAAAPTAGRSWKIQRTPNPADSVGNNVEGVSCPSASACTAVGYYYNTSGVFFPLAEQWNGRSWAIRATPKPARSMDPKLNGVSCTSATACTAVGEDQDRSGTYLTLAERESA